MVEEIETLEQQLQVVPMNTDVLDSFVTEKNHCKTKNLVGLDVDNVFDRVDTLQADGGVYSF
ncbi:hypothetical protein Bca52824_021079 [Brassica carinata]|uniref:Uncharacterized protein n=1 Tax=Brassica carinata TaxID=52824 RepID=A0A8X7VVF6_BRACI|nr:hypothetical protein Bca52824_021079 [Brassica carinata]